MADFIRSCMVKKLQGSYTVEAAFLVPVGFVLILLIVSYSLIYYDRAALCAVLHETAQKEGFQKWKGEEMADEKITVPTAASKSSIELIRTNRMLVAEGRGKSHFLSSMIRPFFFLKEPELENQERVILVYGEEVVREYGILRIKNN